MVVTPLRGSVAITNDPVSRIGSLGATPGSSSTNDQSTTGDAPDSTNLSKSTPWDRRVVDFIKKHGAPLKELQDVELEADRSPIPVLGDFLEGPQSVLALLSAFVVAGSALVWLENLVTSGLILRKSPRYHELRSHCVFMDLHPQGPVRAAPVGVP